MRGIEYAELMAFITVAREKSFAQASIRLGLSRSAISHTVRSLEDRLGARLLNRTTRSVSVTEAGGALLARIVPAFMEISAAVESVGEFRDRPSGTVRINLPRLAAEIILERKIGTFRSRYPDVKLELLVDDAFTDIVASGFDAGIRPGELIQRDMVAVRVSPDLRLAVVASPDYFAARPKPILPSDLVGHDCINYRFSGSGGLYRWPLEKDSKHIDVSIAGPITLNDSNLIKIASLEGAGIACTLESQVADEIASGRLVRVLEDWCPLFPGFFLYYPSRSNMPSSLRATIDFFRV